MATGSQGLLLFLCCALAQITTLTIAQPNFLEHFCSNNLGNYTTNSIYQANLNTLLSSISSNSEINYGFYNLSAGQDSDKVSAIALCRGDVPLDTCRSCISNSTIKLPQLCPNQKEAIGWYDYCMLNYSNRTILDTKDTNPNRTFYQPNSQIVSSKEQFNQALRTLLDDLRRKAASGSSFQKFASGAAPAPDFKRLYALVQCTPNLSEQECSDCLITITGDISNCCSGREGGKVFVPSCILRFETYCFFEPTADDVLTPPSPPPLLTPAPPSKNNATDTQGKGGSNTTKIVIIIVSLLAAIGAALLGFWYYLPSCRKQRPRGEGMSGEILLPNFIGSNHPELEGGLGATDEEYSEEMHCFNLATIQVATNNFSDANKLGQGGFGPVYKGNLPNGKEIAVKRLSMRSSQGLEEFRNEVILIIKLQHKNLVRLLGYYLEGDEKLLVYEYMVNTSLDAFLFDPIKSKNLDWTKRANIITGIARGILYLHEDSRLKIIHRDLKASNVLLDDELNPKISDFGTARIFGGNQIEANTERVVGTYGYIAPEYVLEGLFSIKSDVYSYGILMLEIISGKKNRDIYHPECGQSLLTYAWRMWHEGKASELIDPNIFNSCPIGEVLRWIHIALLCVQDDPSDRPTMSIVVLMLASQAVDLPKPSTPPYSVSRFTSMSDLFSNFRTSTTSTGLSDKTSTSISS